MKRTLSILLCCLFCACSQKAEHTAELVPIRELHFDLPFEPNLITTGYCSNPRNVDGSFYYFLDYRTAKMMFMYNDYGKLTDSLSFKALSQEVPSIWQIVVKSKDSILFTCTSTQMFYHFNRAGVIKRTPIPELKWDGHTFEIYAGPSSVWGNTSYTKVQATAEQFMDTSNGTIDWDRLYTVIYRAPVFARIDSLFSNSPLMTLQLAGLQTRYSPPNRIMPVDAYALSDKYLFYTNPFSDTLYKFKLTNGALERKAHLSTKQGDIRVAPYKTQTDGQEEIDMLQAEKAYISDAKYDTYRHLLYLMFYHEVAPDVPAIKKGEHRAWSMLIYNEKLQKLAEIPFEKDTYIPRSLIVTPEGILLKKVNKNVHELHPKQTYQVFKVVQ